ncbi:LOW QUALITY PROTEIN: hypothetical protein YC2023_040676 [Brassica napus]
MAVRNPTMQRMLSERRTALGLPVRDPEEGSSAHSQLSPRRGSSAPTKGMLNPLSPELELVMADTSAEVSWLYEEEQLDLANLVSKIFIANMSMHANTYNHNKQKRDSRQHGVQFYRQERLKEEGSLIYTNIKRRANPTQTEINQMYQKTAKPAGPASQNLTRTRNEFG